MPEKLQRLIALGTARKSTRLEGYRSIGEYHGGAYETEFVSPYTKSACNFDATVMVLLQDWASDSALAGPFLKERAELGHDPARQTNRRLKELLRTHFYLDLGDTFATNVFPFVKLGLMDAPIPRKDLVHAAREFALPQIEVVAPLLAICLGKAAFNALAVASGHPPAGTLRDAIEHPLFFRETELWCQAHLGRNSISRVTDDWARMASAYKKRMQGKSHIGV